MKRGYKKLFRFVTVYGLRRAIVKAFGRIRSPYSRRLYFGRPRLSVSFIGAGQFSFSTLCFFVALDRGKVFLDVYDVDEQVSDSLRHYYGFVSSEESVGKLLANQNLQRLFIVSNHASHTDYAVKAMRAGVKNLHIEKPISTTYEQFVTLLATKRKNGATLYAGYNRPYSAAIRKLKERVVGRDYGGGMSLNCFVSGHLIPAEHWYRQPEEGTRICGNMGHWLDLAVHMLSWRKLPESFKLQISYSDTNTPDDNLIINISTDLGDIISLTLTARSEPFEGINESINFQYHNVIAKIDDFRRMTVWEGPQLDKYRYFPKDVGHRLAATQVFRDEKVNRPWEEVIVSTLLMLFITDMVREQKSVGNFILSEQRKRLERAILTR